MTQRQQRGPGVPPRIRVLIAITPHLAHAGLRSVMDAADDIVVVGDATSGDEAIALAGRLRPDVVVMHTQLPSGDALAATQRIRADPVLVRSRVLIAAETHEEDLFPAIRAGAHGFLLLDEDPLEFVRAVRAVAGGDVHLSPSATLRLVEAFVSNPVVQRPCREFDALTPRERDLVLLVAQGLSNAEIAERLVISPATVKTHVGHAMTKLHVCDRSKLVALAYQTGFVAHQPREASPLRPAPTLNRRTLSALVDDQAGSLEAPSCRAG